MLQPIEVPKLSVIVPFRNDPHLPYLAERLELQCKGFPETDDIEFMVVDSGSEGEAREQAAEICERYGVRYLYHPTEGQIFSIGAARDFGARYANGAAINFLDADCFVAPDFWPRLLAFMGSYGISRRKKSFFVIPCLYLTMDGTAEFLNADPRARFMDFQLRWLRGDTEAIQAFAPCTSVMVVDRLHYLSVGGHRPEFRGHGFEDFELYHRLIAEDGTLPRPLDYYRDTKTWDTATFNGFRSLFKLLGRPALMANLLVVHLWHPRPKAAGFYNQSVMQGNRDIWIDFFKDFDVTGDHPEPLTDASSTSTVMIFGKQRSNAMRAIRDVIPLIGSPRYVSEYDFLDSDGSFLDGDFETTIRQLGVNKILFPNPYGNPARLAIYRWCRERDFPYLVYERGALPDSWFFDPHGFNADSSTYERRNWDHPLDDDQQETVRQYIRTCLSGSSTLESQSPRIGKDGVAAALKTGNKKVLFVALQRPSDTTMQFLAGDAESAQKFLTMIDEVAKTLRGKGWVVLCKRHPLETDSPLLSYARYVPADTNFLDLIDLADAVALVNSGVGVYSAMAGKPTFVFGQAFYGFDGINVKVPGCDGDALCQLLLAGETTVDTVAVERFIHFLTQFYSFGRAKVASREMPDKSMRSITTAIDFYDIALPDRERISYDGSPARQVSTASPLFERYRLDLLQRKQRAKTPSAQAPVVTTPAPFKPTGPKYNDAVDIFDTKDYKKSAEAFDAIAPALGRPTAYRAAAEAHDRAGNTAVAIERLKTAASLASKPGSINRRIREMSRPRWQRRFRPEKPFPVEKV